MPFPADQMLDVDPHYEILAIGSVTGSASLVIDEYGAGRILVQTGHPATTSIYPFSDEAYIRMVNWLVGGSTDTDNDGILNKDDFCPDTESGLIIDLNGCSINQLCPCDGPGGSAELWRSKGSFVACTVDAVKKFADLGLITKEEKQVTITDAAQLSCGK